ncbi:MAG: acyltransferase family protein [Armatimonadota bacterium]
MCEREEAAHRAYGTRPDPQGGGGRLLSLDAFRGLTIIGMLLVNNAALDRATPSQLTHAAWGEGVHFADLVFPWFLLIVGIALPFSAAKRRATGEPLWAFYGRACRRALLLVLLGMLVDSSIAKTPVVGLGVLQLIGLAYLVAAFASPLGWRWRAALACALLLSHWAALRFLPLPGTGRVQLTETANLVVSLNALYLDPMHLRGLVSVVPTSALVLIGTVIGDLLRSDGPGRSRKSLQVLAIGAGLSLAGWLWSLDIPFSKPLWTASYIVYTGGLGLMLLSFLHWTMDSLGWRGRAWPLVVYGSNAILAYVAPILVKVWVLQSWVVPVGGGTTAPIQQACLSWLRQAAGPAPGGWLYTLSYIAFWGIVLAYLHRKRIFLRV